MKRCNRKGGAGEVKDGRKEGEREWEPEEDK